MLFVVVGAVQVHNPISLAGAWTPEEAKAFAETPENRQAALDLNSLISRCFSRFLDTWLTGQYSVVALDESRGVDSDVEEERMKRKVGTVLGEDLLWKAKQAAAREKKTLSLLLEEALREHLARLEGRVAPAAKAHVQETKGALKVSKRLLDAVLREPGLYATG